MRIRARLKSNRKKRKAQPTKGLLDAFLPLDAFLLVSKRTFSTELQASLSQGRHLRRDPQHSLSYELNLHFMRYNARLITAREQRSHRLSAGLAIVQGPLVHVHRNKPVRQFRRQVAGVV